MAKANREALIEAMRAMDLCFMATKDGDKLCSRPMSNNAQVDWDGSNWFFTNGDTRKIRQLEADPTVMCDYSSERDWVSLRGRAILHRDDKPLFEEHWTPDIDRWFPEGVDTPGLVLIEVVADEAELFGAAGEGVIDLG